MILESESLVTCGECIRRPDIPDTSGYTPDTSGDASSSTNSLAGDGDDGNNDDGDQYFRDDDSQ